jgi:hypothetical protein
MPLYKIAAGARIELPAPFIYFECKSASNAFTIEITTKREGAKSSNKKTVKELDWFVSNPGDVFTKCFVDNTAGTDELAVVISTEDFPIHSREQRVPPTHLNPFGTKTFSANGDTWGPFGGFDDEGRRRMKVHFEMSGVPVVAARIGIYKGTVADTADDDNLIGELSYYKQIFSEPLDAKVTLKLLAGGAGVQAVGHEINHLAS